MKQIARNLTDAEDGFLKGKRYVLMDRDGKFSPAFQAILKTEGVDAVLLPAKSPNLNAHLERFHRFDHDVRSAEPLRWHEPPHEQAAMVGQNRHHLD